MATPLYSQQQREYWVKRPGNIIQLETVEFEHPDFGFIRLVANKFSDKQLSVNGFLETFTAVAMEVPKVTNQETDTTKAGSIIFGRIGIQFRKKLMQITPLGSIKDPITARIRQYQVGIVEPIYERRYYVGKDGISIDAESVNVRLSVDNPAKLTTEDLFYNPSVFFGLKFI